MGVHGSESHDESSDSSAKSMKVETVLPTGGTAVTAAATTASASAKGTGPVASSSSSSAAPVMPGEGKQYWAKGTGYGTGALASQPPTYFVANTHTTILPTLTPDCNTLAFYQYIRLLLLLL